MELKDLIGQHDICSVDFELESASPSTRWLIDSYAVCFQLGEQIYMAVENPDDITLDIALYDHDSMEAVVEIECWRAVIIAEREACAKAVEALRRRDDDGNPVNDRHNAALRASASAIRARKDET